MEITAGMVATSEKEEKDLWNALQPWFMRQIGDFLLARGRRSIGWDEVLDGPSGFPSALPPGNGSSAASDGVDSTGGGSSAVMTWRTLDQSVFDKASAHGHSVILTPTEFTYFDYYQTTQILDEPLHIGGVVWSG